MARWVLLLLALTFTGTAGAAAPEGFRSSYPLAKRAVAISGQPGARVYCARSNQEWMLFAGEQADANGLTEIATKKTYLPGDTCRLMERRLAGRRVALAYLGPAIATLIHESMHLRGVINEQKAECRAIKLLPSVAKTYFRFTSTKSIRTLHSAARSASYCY